jgi:hypothetical protein
MAVTSVDAGSLDYRRPGRIQGRLVGLANNLQGVRDWLASGQKASVSTSGMTVISFPAMPEVLDLARQAEYLVAPVYMNPDGIHVYKDTKPLEIPVSFSLSIHDRDYCRHGALTLLATAAKLHTLVLPISMQASGKDRCTTSQQVGSTYQAFAQAKSFESQSKELPLGTTPPKTKANTANSVDPKATEVTQDQNLTAPISTMNQLSSTYPPVAVLLDLISDGRDAEISMGVTCVGYINSVRTRFKGPWLQPSTPLGKNMPSKLEVEFTFVHYPSYTNSPSGQNQSANSIQQMIINAYADDVRRNFYNTVGLTQNLFQTYQGIR